MDTRCASSPGYAGRKWAGNDLELPLACFRPHRTSTGAAKSVGRQDDGHEEEQIQGSAEGQLRRQDEAGLPVKELCRKGGSGDATFYK